MLLIIGVIIACCVILGTYIAVIGTRWINRSPKTYHCETCNGYHKTKNHVDDIDG